MKILFLVGLFLFAPPAAAVTYNPSVNQMLFDDDDWANAIGFQAQWDGLSWSSASVALNKPVANTHTLQVPFSSGSHTVKVRACNNDGCSAESNLLSFRIVKK